MVQAKQSVQLSASEYVSHLVVFPQTVVAGLTDGALVSLPVTLEGQPNAVHTPSAKQQAPLANLLALPTLPYSILTCDTAGKLKIFDTRQKAALVASADTEMRATACGVSNFGEVGVGTEASPDAQVYVYDVRKLQTGSVEAINRYVDSHNDDITDLQFHPTRQHMLVSASTDGVLNLFDLREQNEDDAVVEAFNHQASVHRTGFFTNAAVKGLKLTEDSGNADRLFALSHMETLSVYPLGDASDQKNEDWGDLRESWECQYVCGFQKQHFLIGSSDEGWAKVVPIVDAKPQLSVTLEGGHGSELVRCFDFWSLSRACYTGGEDGCVRLWDLAGDFDEVARFATRPQKTQKAGKAQRKAKRGPY